MSGTVTEARVAFFKKDALAHFDWRERFDVPEATRLFRFAARCEKSACGHYDGIDHIPAGDGPLQSVARPDGRPAAGAA